MKSLARLSTRRPVAVVVGWIVLVIGLQLLVATVGQDIRDTFSLRGSDAQEAYDLLDERFPAAAGDADTIAFKVSEGTLADAQTQIDEALAEIAAGGSIASVVGPFSPDAVGQVSPDGT